MIKNKSVFILFYFLFAMFSFMFFMAVISNIIGYVVNGGTDVIGVFKNNFFIYLKMGGLGAIAGFVLWIFDVK